MSHSTTTPAAPAQEPGKTSGLNRRTVAHAIRRRPLAFTAVALLAGAAAAAVWFLLPLPKVTAAVSFHVSSREPSILVNSGAEGAGGFNAYKLSQAAHVKSRLTLNAALRDPGVATLPVIQQAEPNPIDWLDRKLEVESKSGSEFMRVTLEGDDGEQLRKILDAVAKAYLAGVEDRDNGPKLSRLAKLQDNEKKYRAEVERFQKEIDNIAYILGSNDGPTLAVIDSINKENLRLADRDLKEAEEEYDLVRRQIEALDLEEKARPTDPKPVPDVVIDRALAADPAMQKLEADIKQLTGDLVKAQKDFAEGSPALTGIRTKLKDAQAARDKYRTEQRNTVEALIRQKEAEAGQTHRETLLNKRALLGQKVDSAKARVDDAKKTIAEHSKHRISLERYKRFIEQSETLSTQMAREIELLKVERDAPPRVTMAEEPYVMTGIEGNRRLKYAMMIALGVFLTGFGGLVLWESHGRRVTSTEDVTTALGVPLLGTVPPVVEGAQNALARAALVEAIDTTRTMLLHGTPRGSSLQTVLITSAVAGEGKTSLTGHLAISLARAGFRTLLIDGDLHSPAAHGLFEVTVVPGLSELLREEVDAATAIRPTAVPGLSVLPAGAVNLTARQALIGERWRRIRKELESQFDFVVIDTAPLLMVSDTLLFAREADGVVLSVLLGVSQVGHVSETAARLRSIGANLAGAVVSGVWHDAYRSSYRYGADEPRRSRTADSPVARSHQATEGAARP
jgi:capsular exopolysaccharide synthesis family protein